MYSFNWLKVSIKVILIGFIILFTLKYTFGLQIQYESDIIINEQETYGYSMLINHSNTTFTETLYNITVRRMDNMFTFETLKNLTYNSTAYLHYNITANSTIDDEFNTELRFFYYTENKRNPMNRTVLLNSSGFTNSRLDVYMNDTVNIKNIDSVNHTLTVAGNPYMISLPVGYIHTIYLSNLDKMTYVDENTLTGLDINVSDNSIRTPTVNPSMYIPLTFDIRAKHRPTTLKVTFTEPISPIDYDESTTGVLILKSQDPVYNLTLKADSWVNFPKNNFLLDNEQVIIFTVTPQNITKTEETGMTYEKRIEIRGENIEGTDLTFNIELLHQNMSEIIPEDSNVVYIIKPMSPTETEYYCSQDNRWEEDVMCMRYLKNISIVEYRDRKIDPNLDEKTVIEYFEKVAREDADTNVIKTTLEQTTRENKENLARLNSITSNNTDTLVTVSRMIGDLHDNVMSEKKQSNFKTGISVTAGIMLISFLGLLVLGYRKKRKKLMRIRKL